MKGVKFNIMSNQQVSRYAAGHRDAEAKGIDRYIDFVF
jgi:hypothetical protein